MPRIRTIKPEFWDSPGTARASLRARLFYIAMWNWADDYGIGTANPKQLIGFAFPNDDDVTVADFPRLRAEVSECFGTQFYEARGRAYYAIPSWDDHQKNERRAKGRHPGPDQAERVIAESGGMSARTDGSSGTGTGEQGNRGKKTSSPRGEGSRPRADGQGDERFDEFWSAYPRKVDKADARKAWAKAIKTNDPTALISAARRYAREVEGKEASYVKHAATWLNKGSFENQPELRVVGAPGSPEERFDRMRVTADAARAARLIGEQWLDPAKPPSDPRPMAQFLREERTAYIEGHAEQIRAALHAAEGRAG